MLLQIVGEFRAGNGPGAETVQVPGWHLAVDQDEAPVAQLADQRREADFGGVVGAAEHGLAEEQLAHGQAVEAANQLLAIPDFHRVSQAALVLVGGASAVMGVLFALQQTDLKRLLAYSSIENLGIIFLALGLAQIFQAAGHPALAALALVAALYQALNHALLKGLLFLGAGAVLHGAHERSLEHLGGLLRRMPRTGWFFLIGCLGMAAVPPLNGFVSEWLTFQAALQAWQLHDSLLRILVPLAAA